MMDLEDMTMRLQSEIKMDYDSIRITDTFKILI